MNHIKDLDVYDHDFNPEPLIIDGIPVSVRMVKTGQWQTYHDLDDAYIVAHDVRFSHPVTRRQVFQTLDPITHKGCRCSRDCCGHYFGGIRTVKQTSRNGRHWQITSRYDRNV